MENIKFRIIYQSPNTDTPNEILISEPLTIEEMSCGNNYQVDFTDGGYLMRDEMNGADDKIIYTQFTELKDKKTSSQ